MRLSKSQAVVRSRRGGIRSAASRAAKRLLSVGLLTAAVVGGSGALAISASASAIPGQLDSGTAIDSGTSLNSPSGTMSLTMQTDGNLVLYRPGHVAIWASGTDRAANSGAILDEQPDGNLVVIAAGNVPVWSSNTSGHPGAVLRVQDDGNVVQYAAGHSPIWSTNTNVDPTPPSGSAASKIVLYATNIMNGDAEPGWSGGQVPYSWGGGHDPSGPGPSYGTCIGYKGSIRPCPADRTLGLDCSGFARWVYSLAYGSDVLGSGNTNAELAGLTQVNSPRPGDLVFYGRSPTNTDHVGVYVGSGEMIDAFETGTVIETDPLTRPTLPLIGYYRR